MYYLKASRENVHIAIFYRNFMMGSPNFCHVGLGVNAIHTAKVLRRQQVRADVFGVWTMQHVDDILTKNPTITHCLIEAVWISVKDMNYLLYRYPQVHFLVRLHSQIGFLQVEAGAIKTMRELILLQDNALNFTFSANSERMASFVEESYSGKCLYLPNLYDMERVVVNNPAPHDHKLLRVSSFGAMRLMKNHTTAAAAAMMLARGRGCDLEFWVSDNREEHGKGVMQALDNMFADVPGMKLVKNSWQDWASFRRTVATMDLCMQISMTETFNITLCDAVAEHVPVVGSPAIEWLPDHCQVDIDQVEDIARVASMELSDPLATKRNFKKLKEYLDISTQVWLDYLDNSPYFTKKT